jgi:hypothetical protein
MMLGRKAWYRICVCIDCGNMKNIPGFRRRQKRKEERSWKNEVRDLWKYRN